MAQAYQLVLLLLRTVLTYKCCSGQDMTWDTESTQFKSRALRHLDASGSFDRSISKCLARVAGSLRG